jgi:hypothetical protein
MDNVYSILFDLEKEYLAFKEAAGTKVKKRID